MATEPCNRSRILVIDDDEVIRLLLMEVLQREGFEVIWAVNGREGLQLAEQERPDLILLDVMMPVMNGFDCLQSLRALPSNETLPIVMLTAADDLDSLNKAYQLGATDFISKPFIWSTLPHRLRYMLRASKALQMLAKSEMDLRRAQRTAHLGSWEWRIADDTMQWSEEVFEVLGVEPQKFQGQKADLFRTADEIEALKLHNAFEVCQSKQQAFFLELSLIHQDGTEHFVKIQGEPIVEGASIVQIHGTVQDITKHRLIEQKVRFLSYYDPLTKLPNRRLFKEILREAFAYSNRYQKLLSVLFISIDRFKRINETLGGTVGDSLLKAFADRLVTGVRDCDFVSVNNDFDYGGMTVSRFAGNEFTVLLSTVSDTQDSVKVAKRIFQIMSNSFNIAGNEIFLGINIGIATFPGDGNDVDSLIRNGQFAMHQASEHGQNTYQYFNKSLNTVALQRLSMEAQLRRAVERDELLLCYQAKINIRHRQVIGCEALVRWQHAEFGLVPPSQFIEIAEDAGLINSISDWVLDAACRQIRDWQLKGLPPLVIAVNISANQFRQHGFAVYVQNILAKYQVNPKFLKLELTETILLQAIEDTMATLHKLRSIGIEISVDDFGTGYSSLAYLNKLPISELKIDSSFIRDIPQNQDDMVITAAILALAKSLSLEVVAEGVENAEQESFLLDQGCKIAQGYYYSAPISEDEFERFVRDFN